jgi:DNA polymerase-3 subunit delta'
MDPLDENIVVQPVWHPWHRPVLERINSLKSQQRLPHAILIDSSSELDGVEFIWGLAMLLLCDEAVDIDPCGKCQSCQLMLANTYPDFKYVSLEYDVKSKKLNKNIKIEQIRDLIHEVNLTNRYDNLKIIAIYPAEKMNLASANSLLKTLEEPGSQVLILLLTHNKGKLPITIRSRCQSWSLDRPEKQVAQNWLLDRGFEQKVSEQYLEYAGGDPLLALKLKSVNYASLVDEFKQQFSLYLKNSIDVTALCSKLIKQEVSLIRRLIKMVISAYCYRLSGLDSSFQVQNPGRKCDARDMIELSGQAESQLMVEDNNLNLQIQKCLNPDGKTMGYPLRCYHLQFRQIL